MSPELDVRSGAVLTPVRVPAGPRAAVLVLHGGSADSERQVPRWSPAALRLVPIARAIARGVPDSAVYRLRNSVRGWNGDGSAVLADARSALAAIGTAHPGTPVVLVGHSLGGRVAAHLAALGTSVGGGRRRAGECGRVAGVVGLAPWLEPDDPMSGLRDVPVVVVQGDRDRMIPTPSTEVWLARAGQAGARIRRSSVAGGEHTMLRHHRRWDRLGVAGVRWVLRSARRPVADVGQNDRR